MGVPFLRRSYCTRDTMTRTELTMKTVPELHDGVQTFEDFTTPVEQGAFLASGVLDIVAEGFGLLRRERYLPGAEDIYVSGSQIRRYALRPGDLVVGEVRVRRERDQYPGLLR